MAFLLQIMSMNYKFLKRGSVLLVLVFLLLACQQQPAPKQYPLHYSDAIFGTSFTIKASTLPSSITNSELRKQVKQLLDEINGQMSTYLQDSELSIINKSRATQWLSVSVPLYTVLKAANDISKLSNGAFDITVGPLVNLWGFGPDPMTFVAPDDAVIEQQLQKIGYAKLAFDDEVLKLKKIEPELFMDLSAIAKGYAVDQIAQLLEKYGINDYMVEIGGELSLSGLNIDNKPWRIAVEKPNSANRMIQKVLPLSNISLATSGDYRNYFELDGVRFSHTIDPRTGRPITHNLASVTILSDSAMKADALATAFMVLGVEQGFQLAEQEKIAALFIVKTDDGFVEKASSSFIEKLR